MRKFTYVDYTQNRKVLLVCKCKSITEADLMYEATFKKHPKTLKYVGCVIKPILLIQIKMFILRTFKHLINKIKYKF